MREKNIGNPVEALLHWEEVQPDKAFLHQPRGGEMTTWTWRQTADRVRRMAAYLHDLALPAGSRIVILSRNCAEFVMADMAILMSGHVSLPIYPSLNAENLRYILEHSEAELAFVGPVEDWAAMRRGIPDDLPLILLPGADVEGATGAVSYWDDIVVRHAPLATIARPEPEDLARMIYTSGSTGQPKGVMISFRALEAGGRALTNITPFTPDDRMLSYLPLAHAFEAAVVEINALLHGFELFFSEGLASFTEDLRRARPTVFHSVPRLWVKFQQAVQAKLPDEELAARLADDDTAEATRRQVLEQLGLQDARVALTGSAPLAASVWRAPNVLERNFTATSPDRVWVGDVTFVPTRQGWLYLAVQIDLYSRLVVGWAMSARNDTNLVSAALKMAVYRRRPKPGLVLHSDQGQTYAAKDYRKLITAHKMRQSMSRKGDCWDNVVAESFFASVEFEVIKQQTFATRQRAQSELFHYIEVFYNRQRVHQTLDYKIPAIVDQAYWSDA